MPEGNEWRQLAGFAEHAVLLAEPERIRAIGTRRRRRRRAGQAVLGTGASLAVVAFLGTGLATGGLGNGNGHGTVSVGRSATVPSTHTGSRGVSYWLPAAVGTARASSLVTALQQSGFVDIMTKSVGSDTVPSGNAVDITDASGHSVLGHQVSITTPLIVVVSAGPAH